MEVANKHRLCFMLLETNKFCLFIHFNNGRVHHIATCNLESSWFSFQQIQRIKKVDSRLMSVNRNVVVPLVRSTCTLLEVTSLTGVKQHVSTHLYTVQGAAGFPISPSVTSTELKCSSSSSTTHLSTEAAVTLQCF